MVFTFKEAADPSKKGSVEETVQEEWSYEHAKPVR